MLRGIGNIKRKTDEAIASQLKNRIWQIKLKDGEQAVFRFLTEPEEVISAEFHSIKEITPRGEWRVSKYCTQDSACKYCAEGLTTGEQIFLWAYVYYILHKNQNPRLDKNTEAPRWKRVKVNEQPFYQEIVNGPMVFRTGPGKGQTYKTTLINYANEYGTYLDRDYKWIREGASKESTAYTLMPKDPSPISSEIKVIMKSLPDLAKVVSGEILSFDQVKSAEAEFEEIEDLEEKVEVAAKKERLVELEDENNGEDFEDLF